MLRVNDLETILDQIETQSSVTAEPGERLQEYLLYCFETRDVVECEAFLALDDQGAIETASARRAGRAAKLWAGSRKVCTFDEAPDRLRLCLFGTS